nr:nephrocystin-4 [Hydra vulgaris]
MSDDADIAETWIDFYEANKPIPLHPTRNNITSSSPSFQFCLTIKNLEVFFQKPDPCNFQLRISFYDAANHWFFGNTWIGLPIKSTVTNNKLHAINIKDQPLYFQTQVNDYTCMLVIEVVYLANEISETVAWTWLRIFSNIKFLTDTFETACPKVSRLDLFCGSPFALLLIPEPIEECSLLKKKPGEFNYTLQTHQKLYEVSHLVPFNVVLSGDDIIPGVSEDISEEEGVVDILQNPQPIKTWPCHLLKILINLTPSVHLFDEQVCKFLNADRFVRDDISPDERTVSIAEKKLKVGVHNGWKFIKEPHVCFLENEYTQNSPSNNKRTESNNLKECIGLIVQSRLELDEIIFHPYIAVIFQLVYVITMPITIKDTSSRKKSNQKTTGQLLTKKVDVAMRTAIWVPFENGKISNKNYLIDLKGGLSPNPFNTKVFNELHFSSDKQKSLGSIQFSLIQLHAKKSNNIPSRRSTLTSEKNSSLPASQDLSVADSVTHNDSVHEEQALSSFVQNDFTTTNAHQVQQSNMLPQSQMYNSLITSNTSRHSTLSRVHYSILHSVDYPKITDTQGNPPFLIDTQEIIKYNISLETRDGLHANDIIFQFLALSRCYHRSVFFTFQFYRFPQTTTERLHLKKYGGEESIHDLAPCILLRSARDGNKSDNSPPGLMIKYLVDPAFMQLNEQVSFLKYLHDQCLYIDMWDGDSLLLVGSTSFPLKYLLRQGKSAVQCSQELDMLFYEYTEDNTIIAGNLMQSSNQSNAKIFLTAKLFFRIANIGCLPSSNTERLNNINFAQNNHIIEPDKTSKFAKIKKNQVAAKLLSDCDSELATVLVARKDVIGKSSEMKKNDINVIRKRKMDRMKAVREIKGGEDTPSMFVLQKEEKVQRTRDLRTIQYYRENFKSIGISNRLEEYITTHHMIYSSLGRAEFFEFSLKNPYPDDQTVLISINDSELKVVLNSLEWRFHKKQCGTPGEVEEQMFGTFEDDVKMFIQGCEKVNIPLKFQSLTASNITPEIGPSHPLQIESSNYSLQTFGKDTTLSSKEIKVKFIGNNNKPLAILIVHVELHPHAIDQTFRFYNPEQTFLKKSIRLPPMHTLPGSSVTDDTSYPHLISLCTDEDAVCETHPVNSGEPHEVFLKVPCGLSPSVRRFFILIFIDEFCVKPCQIWQIFVHSLQKIDISATEGQTSNFSVLLKGTQSSRMVKCYSSHPDELKVLPNDPFMLIANAVQEITLYLSPLEPGKRMMFINVVDQDFHQLVKSWLVMTSCIPPVISKTFEVHLKVGSGSNKKISFTNPYPVKRNFYFKSNREDLIRLKEEGVMLGGGESHNIGILFLPQQSSGSANVLIFINDRYGKNEESFCIKVEYSL